MHKTTTQEKQELVRRFASGEVTSAQFGKKVAELDRKNRTRKVAILSKFVALLTLILAPFLVHAGHFGSPSSSSSPQ